MPIPTSIADLSTTESANSPQGGDPVGGTVDNYFRAHAAILKRALSKGGFSLTSQSTLPVPADGMVFTVEIVGSTINAIANVFDGKTVILHFTGVCTLVHSANLVLPTGSNVTTISGDIAMFTQLFSGTWVCVSWDRASAKIAVDQSQAALDAYELEANDTFVDNTGDTMTGTLTVETGGFRSQMLAGSLELISSNPYIDFSRSLVVDYEWRAIIDGSGDFVFEKSGGQQIHLLADGNIYSPKFGFLSDTLDGKQPAGSYQAAGNYVTKDVGNVITLHWNNGLYRKIDGTSYVAIWDAQNFDPNSKAGAGAQVVHNSATVEFGPLSYASPAGPAQDLFDLPDPYVMTGLRRPAGSLGLYIRAKTLRNQ